MVHRTVVTIAILCGASAAAALAFGISRAGSHLTEHAIWRRGGFTTAPASGTSVHAGAHLAGAPDETPRGEYCRVPPSRVARPAAAVPSDTLLTSSIGSTRLGPEGQSRLTDALPPALCPGDTGGTFHGPRVAKP